MIYKPLLQSVLLGYAVTLGNTGSINAPLVEYPFVAFVGVNSSCNLKCL